MKEKQDKIYIIGAGTVGKALAVMLKSNSKKVILVRGSVDNIDKYFETIKVMFNGRNYQGMC